MKYITFKVKTAVKTVARIDVPGNYLCPEFLKVLNVELSTYGCEASFVQQELDRKSLLFKNNIRIENHSHKYFIDVNYCQNYWYIRIQEVVKVRYEKVVTEKE